MATLSNYKCPSCGAPLQFSAEGGNLHCNSCGNDYSVESIEALLHAEEHTSESFDWGNYKASLETQTMEDTVTYVCKACGAEVVTTPTTVATHCPYCDNEIVIDDRLDGGLRPNGIIPFAVDKARLKEIVADFYKDKKLLPKNYFSDAKLEEILGVYVPFWLFDCTMDGTMTFDANSVRVWVAGDYEFTETKTWRLIRSGDLSFRKVPVDASIKMDDALMDSLEPFDYKAMVPFQGAYLAGFLADRFDADPDLCLPRATSRMNRSVEEVLGSYQTDGVSGVRLRNNAMALRDTAVHYVLLPVYLINCKYGGKSYQYAVNGQTGKIVGTLPISRSRSLLYRFRDLLIAGIPAAGIIALLSYIF